MALIDRWGRKPLQIGGFALLTILFSIIGFGWYRLGWGGLFTFFCLVNLVSNAGPNTTTFIVPGEHFPTKYRATAHGISAASGKVGSILSQVLYVGLKDHGGVPNGWVNHIMEIFAAFMYTTPH